MIIVIYYNKINKSGAEEVLNKRSDSVGNIKGVIVVKANRDGGSGVKELYSWGVVERILQSKVEIPDSVEEKIQNAYRNCGVIHEPFPKKESSITSCYPVSKF